MLCKYRAGNKKYHVDEVDLKATVRKMQKDLSDSDYMVRIAKAGDANDEKEEQNLNKHTAKDIDDYVHSLILNQ